MKSNKSGTDDNTTVQELKNAYVKFRTERGWDKYNTPHNLAVSICLEAAELLEHYQWGDKQLAEEHDKLADELADIVSYCLQFADVSSIDLTTALYRKLEHIKKRYPVATLHDEQDLDSHYALKRAYRTKGKAAQGGQK